MKTTLDSKQYQDLRTWLKEARLQKGLSLRELGRLAGVDFSLIGKIEKGRRYIDIVEFVNYCKILGIDPHHGISIVYTTLSNDKNN